MRICIYQIEWRKDTNKIRGCSMKVIHDLGETICPAIYHKTMDAEIPCYNLEDFLVKYSEHPPAAHIGREFGISDIIKIKRKYYFHDNTGMIQICFEPDKRRLPHELQCVILEPRRAAYSALLPDNTESIDRVLGIYGYMRMREGILLDRNVVCLHTFDLRRPYNRQIKKTGILGPAVICGVNEGTLVSLTAEQMEHYLTLYAEADYFISLGCYRSS